MAFGLALKLGTGLLGKKAAKGTAMRGLGGALAVPAIMTAGKIATGIARAAGGLLGSGKSGNVEDATSGVWQGDSELDHVTDKKGKSWASDSPQGKMIIASRKTADPLVPATDITGTTGDWKETMLSLVTNIDTSVSGLLSAAQSELDIAEGIQQQANLDKTDIDDGGEKEEKKERKGILKGLKGMLGGAYSKAKGSWLFKALGIGGLILAFNKWEDEITGFIADVLESFGKIYDYFTDPEFTFDKFKDDLVSTFWPNVKTFIWDSLVSIWNMIKQIGTDFGRWVFGKGDMKVQEQAGTLSQSTAGLSELQNKLGDLGVANMNLLTGEVQTKDGKWGSGDNLSDENRAEVTRLAKEAFGSLWGISNASDFTIQWTGLPAMDPGLTFDNFLGDYSQNKDLAGGVAISHLMDAQPIVNGVVMDRSVLADYNQAQLGGWNVGMPEEQIKRIKELNREMTNLKWMQQASLGTALNDLNLTRAIKTLGIVGELGDIKVEERMQSLIQQKIDVGAVKRIIESQDLTQKRQGLTTDLYNFDDGPSGVTVLDNSTVDNSQTALTENYTDMSVVGTDQTAQLLAYAKNLSSTTRLTA